MKTSWQLLKEHVWPLRRRFCCQEISVECTLRFPVEVLYARYKLSCCPPSSPLPYTETQRQTVWIIHLFMKVHPCTVLFCTHIEFTGHVGPARENWGLKLLGLLCWYRHREKKGNRYKTYGSRHARFGTQRQREHGFVTTSERGRVYCERERASEGEDNKETEH